MLTVFVGNNNQHLADTAISHDPTAYLIDSSNYKNTHYGTIFVSLADLEDVSQFNTVLRAADVIVYVSDNSWSDNSKSKFSLKNWTERSVQIFSLDQTKSVINCPSVLLYPSAESMLHLIDYRKSESRQLWVAGCSTTYGIGVESHQTYASLLSKELNVEYSLLALSGTSIKWAADQILRSDIRYNDIVVWGLTSEDRLAYYQDELLHINTSNFSKIAKDVNIHQLDNQNSKYQSLTAIFQVINHCNSIGAKLVMVGIHLHYEFAFYLKDMTNYIHLNNCYGVNSDDLYPDYGSDQLHPGPITHQWYTDKILKVLT